MKNNQTDTLGAVLERIVQDFEAANLHYGHGTSNAHDEAAWLLLHQLALPLHEPASPAMPITAAQLAAINTLVEQRIQTRKPLAYLLQSCWFCDLHFYIDERAIVPRSPIAELIKAQFQPWITFDKPALKILDMCTGSACIAIAIAKHLQHVEVDAVDISQDALAIATRNVQQHQVEDQVNLICSDGFAQLHQQPYDLIICNPPYVAAEEMQQLPDEYKHEPAMALASGDDGLDFVKDFLAAAPTYLHERGAILLEVGNTQQAFEEAFARLDKIWITFEQGGDGVCFIESQCLKQFYAA